MHWITFDFDTAPKDKSIYVACWDGEQYEYFESSYDCYDGCFIYYDHNLRYVRDLNETDTHYYLQITPPNEEKESMHYL